MSDDRSTGFACWSAATILLGSFLLFQVQPMISKMILPWFGGSPAVWTTCLLFFQVLLLGGYAYADLLVRLKRPVRQMAIHLPLLASALLVLPITPGLNWKPASGEHATASILLLLLAKVGLPYFLLSANAPLVQAWFARVSPRGSPYRLYALSNVASLAALLSYPFLVEPWLATDSQGSMWSWSFCAFAFCCATLTILGARRAQSATASVEPAPGTPANQNAAARSGWGDRLSWMMLPALGSVMLLSVTNHLCQDVAVIPLFWIAPLSLYLLTFIICFDREQWYVRRWFGVVAAGSIVLVCSFMLDDTIVRVCKKLFHLDVEDFRHLAENVFAQSAVYLAMLFFVCLVCHGELVRRKPVAGRLTSFYLMMSAGGALGGVFVALVCPVLGSLFDDKSPWRRLFSMYFELHLAIVAAFILAISVIVADRWIPWFRRRRFPIIVGSVAIVGAITSVAWAQVKQLESEQLVVIRRNFYGTLRVVKRGSGTAGGLALYNGRILHGFQYASEPLRGVATTYYEDGSGVAVAIEALRPDQPKRIGVVGLGAGTIAALGKPGDYIRFYEINSAVRDLAEKGPFTFLRDSAAKSEVVLGDARLQLENELKEGSQQFDVLALDAFSGDAIPVHLITAEAFEVYRRHLKSDGVIAFHISNRYLDLVPVVMGLVERYGWRAILVDHAERSIGGYGTSSSDWILVTQNEALLEEVPRCVANLPADVGSTTAYEPQMRGRPTILWTDRFSNLFKVLGTTSSTKYRPVAKK